MTVLLVLALFALMLGAEYIYEKRRRPALIAVAANAVVAVPAASPAVVSGFNVLDNLRYHPGHTWALQESPELVRVGADDFAARLTGHVEKINLPATGTWIRQGQKAVSAERNGRRLDLVSPIEGIIVETNAKVASNPDLALKDPYGEGWLFKVSAPDAPTPSSDVVISVAAGTTMLPVPRNTDASVLVRQIATSPPNRIWA